MKTPRRQIYLFHQYHDSSSRSRPVQFTLQYFEKLWLLSVWVFQIIFKIYHIKTLLENICLPFRQSLASSLSCEPSVVVVDNAWCADVLMSHPHYRQVPLLSGPLLPLRLGDLHVGGRQSSQLEAQLPDVANAGQEGPGVGGSLQDLPLRVSPESDGQARGLWLHLLPRCEYSQFRWYNTDIRMKDDTGNRFM